MPTELGAYYDYSFRCHGRRKTEVEFLTSPRSEGKPVSYDLMVFDTTVAPRDRMRFLAWFEKQSEWPESHGYNDPEIPAPALQQWFRGIIEAFPR